MRPTLTAAWCVALAACGCSPAPKPATPTANPATPTTATPQPLVGTATQPSAAPAPSPADLLADLKARPRPELLTDEFKTLLTGKSGGSADWDAGNILRDLALKLTAEPPITATVGTATLLAAPAGPERLLAQVVPTPAGPRFNWLQLAPATPEVTPATLPATFTASAFLTALTEDRTTLAASLLTPAAKARLAPPRGDADQPLGHSPSVLKLRLNALRNRAKSFTLTPVTNPAEATAELSGRTVRLKLTPGTGRIEVDGFEAE